MTDCRLRGSRLLAFALTVVVVCSVVLVGTFAVAASDSPTVTLDAPINASTDTQTDAAVTIAQGTLTVSGHATDEAGLSHIKIHRTYEYNSGSDRQTRRSVYYATPRASNGTFSHDVPLGTGTNHLNISVVDEDGYPTNIDVVVHVDDTAKPTADLEAHREGRWVHLEGTVRDDVQVGSVHAGGQAVQIRTGKLDLARDEIEVSQRIPDPGGEAVTARVRDRAGNTREVTLPIGPAPTPTPTATPSDTTTTPTAPATPDANTTATATPNTAAAAPTGTPPPVTTPAPSAEGGGPGLLGIVGLVVVVGGGLLMLSAGGGSW